MEFAVLGAHAASAARAENEHLLCAMLEAVSYTHLVDPEHLHILLLYLPIESIDAGRINNHRNPLNQDMTNSRISGIIMQLHAICTYEVVFHAQIDALHLE